MKKILVIAATAIVLTVLLFVATSPSVGRCSADAAVWEIPAATPEAMPVYARYEYDASCTKIRVHLSNGEVMSHNVDGLTRFGN